MKFDAEEIAEAVAEIGEALQDADKYVAVGKALVVASQPILVDVLKTVIKTYVDVRGELEPELAAHSVLATKAIHRDYQNYQKAGFTKAQAFALVLAAVKPVNFSEALSNGVKSASTKSKE